MNNCNIIVKKFIYLACIFGMLFVILTPPFQAPDEDSHFKKSYVISKGDIFPVVHEGQAGFVLPEEMINYIKEQNDKAGNFDVKFEYDDIYLKERLPAADDNLKFDAFSTAKTNPLAHVIQASGMFLGSLFAPQNPSVVYLLYFARISNLIFYVFIIALAIHTTPVLKKTFALIGLMPMSLFLASTLSYDSMLISLTFLATAIIFRISFDEHKTTLSKKDIIVLSIIAYMFIAVKIVYLPLYFLLLFLPTTELKDKKSYTKKLLLLIILIGCIYILFRIITPALNGVILNDQNRLASNQMTYVMQHPIEYCKIFIETIQENKFFLIATTIGTFGLLDTYLYSAFLVLYMIGMPIIAISEVSLDDIKIRFIDRIIVFISVAASIIGCFLAMYIYWTSILDGYGVGAQRIVGVQGRYFIPMIPIAFLLFANQRLKKNTNIKKIMSILTDNFSLLSTIMLSVSVVSILLRFWC